MKFFKTLYICIYKLVPAIVVLSLFLFGGVQQTQAQNGGLDTLYVVEEAEFLSSEIIADRDENRDDNGRLAAGLQIQTDLTGLSFKANNGVIKTKNQPGETLLYLSPDEIRVQVYKDGFKPLSIILREEGIDLRKGKVWQLQITGTKEEDKLPVNIIPDPSDAQIRVDGAIVESMPVQLAPGKHDLQIQRENFNSIDTTITVSENQNLFQPILEEVQIQQVSIESTPPGATIFFNNSPIGGETPHEFFEFPGQYELTLAKEGYINISEQITIKVGENNFNYNLLRNISYLDINVEPASAQILLNNETISNGEQVERTPGKYKLEVTADGYNSHEEVLDLQRDSTITKNISLGQKQGNLQLTVAPRFASITLNKDGQQVRSWEGLNILNDLPAGTYQIVADATGHLRKTQSVTIEDGKTSNVDLKLVPIEGISTVNLSGIPGDAKIKFNGIGSSNSGYDRSFDDFPVNNQSIDYGLYELVVKKEGFKPIKKRIRIDEDSEQLTVSGDFVPKSKGSSVMWSVFLPGGGQFYMGRSGRGFVYLLANAAAIGYTVNAGLNLIEQRSSYQDAMDRYRTANSDFDPIRATVNETYDAQQAAQKKFLIGLGAVAAVKLIELLDNMLYPSPQKKLQQANLDLESEGSSLVLRFNF